MNFEPILNKYRGLESPTLNDVTTLEAVFGALDQESQAEHKENFENLVSEMKQKAKSVSEKIETVEKEKQTLAEAYAEKFKSLQATVNKLQAEENKRIVNEKVQKTFSKESGLAILPAKMNELIEFLSGQKKEVAEKILEFMGAVTKVSFNSPFSAASVNEELDESNGFKGVSDDAEIKKIMAERKCSYNEAAEIYLG